MFSEKNKTPVAFNYRNTYNLFMDDFFLNFKGQQTVDLYNFKKDRMLTQDLKAKKEDVVAKMDIKMKAIIQQYNN